MQYGWDKDDFYQMMQLGVSANNRRYVTYHGTTRRSAQAIQASGFSQSAGGMLGRGVYLSRDLEKARRYPINHPESDKVVIEVVVNVGRGIVINHQGQLLQKTWHGRDTESIMQYGWDKDDFYQMMQLGVSANNRRYDMNHGTTRRSAKAIQASGFSQSAGGMLGRSVHLSRDLKKARRYPTDHPESDKVVIKVVVNVGRGIVINHQGQLLQKTWHGRDPESTMLYEWVEDDFYGVMRLGVSAPEFYKEYTMYHGTTRRSAQTIQASGFCQSAGGMLGRGVYLSRDLEKARRYPIGHPESDKVVIKVRVNVGKVIAINHQGHPLQKSWYNFGYDTAWVPSGCGMVRSGLEEDCVWDPNRIKIIDVIKPRLVPRYFGGGAYGYM